MFRTLFVSMFAGLVSLAGASGTLADQTRVEVRVISKAAKFIGTSMGGVAITICDADTGEMLASGKTTGSTGDTAGIMKQRHRHHDSVATDDAAVFRSSLDLDEPRQIRVTVHGPLAQRQAINSASVTQWIVPGKHITGGDGLLLELPGFVVDVLDPPAHQMLDEPPGTVSVKANVTMMCGCPIEPGGLWDASEIEVAAIVKHDGKKLTTVPMQYAGSTSQFSGEVKMDKPGAYAVTVYAYDASNGNTGLDSTTVVVAKQR